MFDYFEKLIGLIVTIINSLGYWGIGAGMMIESACIPLPSEVVLPLAGNMVSNGTINMVGANIAVAVGSLTGSLIAYSVGYFGGRPFILKYGKYFFVSQSHFYQAERTFKKYGSAAVFFGRLLPVIRTFISLPAGIAKLDLKKFIAYSLIGMIPWNFILIFLGYKLGPQFKTLIEPIYKRFEYIVIGAFLLIIIYFVYKYYHGRKKSAA